MNKERLDLETNLTFENVVLPYAIKINVHLQLNKSLNMADKLTPIIVSKESIADMNFPSEDVLQTADAIQTRKTDLERATTLGNVEQNKTKIIFEDIDGLKQVETTIWATTDKRIVLKGGVVIPINRIHQVKFI